MSSFLRDHFRNDSRFRAFAKRLEPLETEVLSRLALAATESLLANSPSFRTRGVPALLRRVAQGKPSPPAARTGFARLANERDHASSLLPRSKAAEADGLYLHARFLDMLTALADENPRNGALEAIYVAATAGGVGEERLLRMLDELPGAERKWTSG